MWKQIDNTIYEISDKGLLRNTKTGKVQKPDKQYKGYFRYTISKKHFFAHRLVALAFISNPDNKVTVNHKDGNKENNRVDNLEWMTDRENNDHALSTGLRKLFIVKGEDHFNAKLTEEQAKDIKYSTNTPRELKDRYNVSLPTIYKIRSGEYWKHI